MEKLEQEKKEENTTAWDYYGFAMRIMGDFSLSIAIPVIVSVFIGIWIDEKLGTSPGFLALLLVLSFILTGYIIRKKAYKYGKIFDRMIKK